MKSRILSLAILLITTVGYSQFNSYVPQNPVRAMRDVGMYKQRLYDERLNWIQQKIYSLNDLNSSLFNEDKLPADFGTLYHKTKLNKVMTDYTDSIKAYDFAENYIFSSIQDNFRKIEKYYYDYYNNEVVVYNSKKR
jgi:xanthosine utilization system XapX-like protein